MIYLILLVLSNNYWLVESGLPDHFQDFFSNNKYKFGYSFVYISIQLFLKVQYIPVFHSSPHQVRLSNTAHFMPACLTLGFNFYFIFFVIRARKLHI